MITMQEIINRSRVDIVAEEKFSSSRADADAARSVKSGESKRQQLKGNEAYISKEVSRVQKGMRQLAKEINQIGDTISKKTSGEDLNKGDILYLSAMADKMSDSFLRLHHYANYLRGLKGTG